MNRNGRRPSGTLLVPADGVDDKPQGLPWINVFLPRTTIAEYHAYRRADEIRHGDVEQAGRTACHTLVAATVPEHDRALVRVERHVPLEARRRIL